MLHISKMADHRVEKVEDVMNIGDEIEVKVNEIDSQGRINLIRNDMTYPAAQEGGFRSSASGDRHRPPRRDGRPWAETTQLRQGERLPQAQYRACGGFFLLLK